MFCRNVTVFGNSISYCQVYWIVLESDLPNIIEKFFKISHHAFLPSMK